MRHSFSIFHFPKKKNVWSTTKKKKCFNIQQFEGKFQKNLQKHINLNQLTLMMSLFSFFFFTNKKLTLFLFHVTFKSNMKNMFHVLSHIYYPNNEWWSLAEVILILFIDFWYIFFLINWFSFFFVCFMSVCICFCKKKSNQKKPAKNLEENNINFTFLEFQWWLIFYGIWKLKK